jgi:hypothetical protein
VSVRLLAAVILMLMSAGCGESSQPSKYESPTATSTDIAIGGGVEIPVGTPPYAHLAVELTTEEANRALRLVEHDPRVVALVGGGEYSVSEVVVWVGDNNKKIGAGVYVELQIPQTVDFEFPAIYTPGQGGPSSDDDVDRLGYGECVLHYHVERLDRLAIHVDLREDRVVQIKPGEPDQEQGITDLPGSPAVCP